MEKARSLWARIIGRFGGAAYMPLSIAGGGKPTKQLEWYKFFHYYKVFFV
jgi:hypothetical protein